CNKERSKDRQFTMGGLMEATEYEFRVLAENESGISRPRRTATGIKTKLSEMEDVTTKLGQSGTLKCQIIGRPLPDIKWYRFGKELIQSRKYKMSSDGRNHSLSILTDEQEDEGLYTCRAINDAGEIETSGKLFLQAAPQLHPGFPLKEKYFAGCGTSLNQKINNPNLILFVVPAKIHLPKHLQGMGAVHALRGDVVTIKIPFSGKPEPVISWQKGQEVIDNSVHHQVIVTRSFTSLVFPNGVERKDAGFYIISAKNRFGSDQQTVELDVADVPDAPKNIMVSDLSRDSVTLTWSAPASDGGSQIISYILEKCPTSGDRWIRVAQTQDTHYTVSVFGKTQYQFRVIAENKFGQSKPSEPTEPIVTKEDKSIIRNYDDEVDETREIKMEEAQCSSMKTLSAMYTIAEELSRGQFGIVHRCVETSSKKTFMAKFVKAKGMEQALVKKEIETFSFARHKNILYLQETFESLQELVMIFEFISGVDIFERLGTANFDLTEREIARYLRQVCDALQFLHSKNYAHFDIRPDNIIYTTRKSSIVKIIEMGQARLLVPGENVRIQFTAPEYCAPEVHQHDVVSTVTDMWSVGVLAYVLLSGLNPFTAENTQKMIERICNVDYTFDAEAFSDISLEAMDFIDRLLTKERKHRMTAAEALEHPWLKMKTEQFSTKVIKTLRHRRYYHTLVKKEYNFIVSAARIAYGLYQLVIHNVQAEDDAEYTVLAQNRFGDDSCTARLTVTPHPVIADTMKPLFKRLLANVECTEGESVRFELRVTGSPAPALKWEKDNLPLEFGPKIEVIQEGLEYYVLHIRETLPEDSGTYRVTASNPAGSISCQATLKVDRVTYTKREYKNKEEKE
ncbi:titin-like, partial [Arapaima gigas]